MTTTTNDYAKRGTVEYVAVARMEVPLADPDAWGNLGLQGRDEFFQNSRPFVDLDGAVTWARWAFSKLEDCYGVEIDRIEWTADTFYDDRYGTVYDAIGDRTRRWVWVLGTDGPVLDEEYDPR